MKSGKKRGILILAVFLGIIVVASGMLFLQVRGRTQIQFDIHQNREAIYLSTYSEPPQFAIWIEDPAAERRKTVFVTSRVSKGDWEGKKNVPVALPRWFSLFKEKEPAERRNSGAGHFLAVTGATPKEDYFSVRIEVPPGSKWDCWIEMNLAGDYNDSFPEFNESTFQEDEFSCGQPALLFYAGIEAREGVVAEPKIVSQSVWNDGTMKVEAVSEGVTTARNVFDEIRISVIKPKVKLIADKIPQGLPKSP